MNGWPQMVTKQYGFYEKASYSSLSIVTKEGFCLTYIDMYLSYKDIIALIKQLQVHIEEWFYHRLPWVGFRQLCTTLLNGLDINEVTYKEIVDCYSRYFAASLVENYSIKNLIG